MNVVCMEARRKFNIPGASVKSGQPLDMHAGNTTLVL